MKISTLLKGLSIFAVAKAVMGGDSPAQPFGHGFNVCNAFHNDTNTEVLVGGQANNFFLPPQHCKEFNSTICTRMQEDEEQCYVGIDNQQTGQNGGSGAIRIYQNGTMNWFPSGEANANGCLSQIGPQSFVVRAPVNFTCPNAEDEHRENESESRPKYYR